jgi:hypothetical protein
MSSQGRQRNPKRHGHVAIVRFKLERLFVRANRVFQSLQFAKQCSPLGVPGRVVGIEPDGGVNFGKRLGPMVGFAKLLSALDALLGLVPVVQTIVSIEHVTCCSFLSNGAQNLRLSFIL